MGKVTFEPHERDNSRQHVLVDGKRVGHVKRAQSGPGFFLALDGKQWQNTPGARWAQEKEAAAYTYVKTLKAAKTRTLENV